ncbi:DHDH [Cordylochernes scorpioides]|uniref:Trans-1,2-dihydrobenzene-1,2-diol dehydrogenase n=1 Tax=Cordylochernes scorpioides TaxID=51811 RepID=A0ABY6K980_9ARAC|nr:DHDH [Cordylochernes scorpioides]
MLATMYVCVTDVVYVGSINPQHLPVGEQVLRAGKALLVEKPMGLNHRQTEQLVTLARSQGVFLMEALWSRFLPAYSHLRQEISRGAVGEVSHVEASFGFPMEVERLSRKDMGGSTILDIGIYTLNAVCMAYGDLSPEKVVALGNLNSEGVDESVTASLKFGPRQLASISTSAYCKLPCDLVVTGTRGQLKLLDPFWCPTKLQLPSGEIMEFPMPEPSRPCNYINSGGLCYQAQEVRRCLQQGRSSYFLSPLNHIRNSAFAGPKPG